MFTKIESIEERNERWEKSEEERAKLFMRIFQRQHPELNGLQVEFRWPTESAEIIPCGKYRYPGK